MMEKCHDTLGLGFKGDTTIAYYIYCEKKKGHRGKHCEKGRVKRGVDIMEYSIYWKTVKNDSGKFKTTKVPCKCTKIVQKVEK